MASANDNKPVTHITDHLSLQHFAGILEKVKPPTDSFSADGSWRESFVAWTCPRASAGRVGTVTLTHTPAENDTVQLTSTFDRTLGPGGRHVTTERIHYRRAELPTPERWTIESRGFDADGSPVEAFSIKLDTRVENGRFTLRSGSKELQRFALPGGLPWTCRWLLFDAVRRLPRRGGERREFTFLAHGETPKSPHVIAWRQSTNLVLGARFRTRYVPDRHLEAGTIYRPVAAPEGGQAIPMHVFEHVGPGLLPTVYWVDHQGRLLFVVSGLEAYVRI